MCTLHEDLCKLIALARKHSRIWAQNGHFNVRLTAIKFSRLTWVECGPCPVFECYTLAFTLQLRKKSTEKTSVRVVDKVPDGHDSVCRHGRHLHVARTSCQSWSPCFRAPGSTLSQLRYLLSCVTKGFPTSANFESNLSEFWSVR